MVNLYVLLYAHLCHTRTLVSTTRMHSADEDAPYLAKTLAGVPFASRINMGRSGLCCLIMGYVDEMNCLHSRLQRRQEHVRK